MKNVIIIRWGEIHLKGKNRGHFEKLLEQNIKHALLPFDCKLNKISGRYVVSEYLEYLEGDILTALSKVGGIHSVSPSIMIKTDLQAIIDTSIQIMSDKQGTFKVETKRADKKFPINSVDLSRKLGGGSIKN